MVARAGGLRPPKTHAIAPPLSGRGALAGIQVYPGEDPRRRSVIHSSPGVPCRFSQRHGGPV